VFLLKIFSKLFRSIPQYLGASWSESTDCKCDYIPLLAGGFFRIFIKLQGKKMKKLFKTSIALVFSLSLLNISNAMAITQTFFGAAASDLITETSGTYTSSINYTPFWTPGNVTSATLTLLLSDDVSTTLNSVGAIDLPREWARVTDIRDGASSLGSQAAVEVETTNPFFDPANVFPLNSVFSGSDGYESPLTANPITGPDLVLAASGVGLISPSIAGYSFDVTSLLNASSTGVLSFDLVALDLYNTSLLPAQFVALANLFGFNQQLAQTTYEDFLFTGAELRVSAVPEPSMYLMLALGLFGMFVSRKWAHRNS